MIRLHAKEKEMQEPSVIAVPLRPGVERKLARLSERTRRSAAALAADAIASYVDRESAILDGIARGMDDMRSGRLVPHDEAMDELDAAIAAAGRERK
jgi:predicted transcriptional regulator